MIGKLRPEVKVKWLEALRSGRYRQGRGYLGYSEEGRDYYCCLGVLCEIAAEEGVIARDVRQPSVHNGDEVGNEASDQGFDRMALYVADGTSGFTMPPSGLIPWAYEDVPGAYDQWRVQVNGAPPQDLSGLNDDGELTFTEIADVIEESL